MIYVRINGLDFIVQELKDKQGQVDELTEKYYCSDDETKLF